MKTLVVMLLALLASRAHAQALDLDALADGTNVVTLTTGAEHGLVVGVGYGRATTLADHPLLLDADLTVDAAQPDVHDARLRAGVLVPLLARGHWRLIGGASAIVRTTTNELARMVDLGTDVAALAGRYTPRWFAAAELGADWAIATHIAPSDDYRMLVYPDARDGWYRNTGALLRLGIQSGISFAGNDVALRIGILRDTSGNPPMFPFYVTLGYARRW